MFPPLVVPRDEGRAGKLFSVHNLPAFAPDKRHRNAAGGRRLRSRWFAAIVRESLPAFGNPLARSATPPSFQLATWCRGHVGSRLPDPLATAILHSRSAVAVGPGSPSHSGRGPRSGTRRPLTGPVQARSPMGPPGVSPSRSTAGPPRSYTMLRPGGPEHRQKR